MPNPTTSVPRAVTSPARVASLILVAACSTAGPPTAATDDPLGATTRVVATRLGPIVIHEAGVGAPLVLLHAIGHDHRDFDAIAPRLATHGRVLAVDWPGHGDSPMPAQPDSVRATDFADALEELSASLDVGAATYPGNSVGGFAAARLAARHPDRVAALILVDPGGFGELGWLDRTFCRLKGSETVTSWLWNAFPEHYLVVRNAAVLEILDHVRAAESPAAIRLQAAVWRSFLEPAHDLRAEAPSIRARTLFAWGDRDPVLPVEDGERATVLISGARMIPFDTGHMPFAEAPEAFLAAIEPFLEARS